MVGTSQHLIGKSLFLVMSDAKAKRVSTTWTREHWAKLSEDRKETAGLIATGSCGSPKLSKICKGSTISVGRETGQKTPLITVAAG